MQNSSILNHFLGLFCYKVTNFLKFFIQPYTFLKNISCHRFIGCYGIKDRVRKDVLRMLFLWNRIKQLCQRQFIRSKIFFYPILSHLSVAKNICTVVYFFLTTSVIVSLFHGFSFFSQFSFNAFLYIFHRNQVTSSF
jgi:hypothetical protein